MINSRLISICSLLLYGLAFFWSGLAAADVMKKSPFVYSANQETPEEIIQNISATFGYTVKGVRLGSETVTAKIQGNSLADALNDLGKAFQFDWFVFGGTVYLHRPDRWRTEEIYVGDRDQDDWKEELEKTGLWNSKFKVVPKKIAESVVVTAPLDYINLFKSNYRVKKDEKKKEESDSEIMYFKLQHASVDDRVFTFRDKEITSPGVVSVLRGVLQGTTSGSQSTNTSDSRDREQKGSLDTGNDLSVGSMREPKKTPASIAPSFFGSSNLQGPKGPIVQGDSRTNTVILRDKKERYAEFKKLIDTLDVPLAMIEIEATLIDVDQRVIDELGVEFGIRGPRTIYDFPGASVGQLPLPGLINGAVISSPAQFIARIQALAANERAKVLARPTILTQDNLGAFIDLTETFYVRLTGERVADLVPVTAGSLLRVLPRIVPGENGSKISLQVDIQDGSLRTRQDVDLPIVQNSSLSTEALISENQAILIGGYNRESEEDTSYEVPVLGKIPVLGRLFSSKSTSKERVARLFMITPRLIPANSDVQTVGTVRANSELRSSFKIIQGGQPLEILDLKSSGTLAKPKAQYSGIDNSN